MEQLIRAMGQRKIADIDPEVLSEFVSTQITQCYFMVGYQTYEERPLTVLTAKLMADLLQSYRYFTREEISFCFEAGVKGAYGEYTGINLRTFHRWLKSYQTSELRYRAKVALQREAEQKALPAVSEEYKRQREDAFLQSVFRQYKAGYPLERLYPTRVYLALQRRGVIRNTPEEKREAMAMFANYRPVKTGCASQYMPEETRQWLVKAKAMEWLLKREFDRMERLRLES